MVTDPEPELKRLFEFIGEPWDNSVLSYHQGKHDLARESSADQVSQPLYSHKVGRWERELSLSDLETVMEVASAQLRALGVHQK